MNPVPQVQLPFQVELISAKKEARSVRQILPTGQQKRLRPCHKFGHEIKTIRLPQLEKPADRPQLTKKERLELLRLPAVLFVPRAGVEPARVAPLVFETSASTDSAIWATNFSYEKRCKGKCFFVLSKGDAGKT